MTRLRSTRTAALVALASCALAACGTTVPLGQQGLASSNGTGLTQETTSSQSAAPTVPGQAEIPTGPTTVDPATGAVTTPGSAGSGPGATAPGVAAPGAAAASLPPVVKGSIPVTGPGWDKTTVSIGVVTVKDLQKVAGALGLSLDTGDTEAQAKAVAAYVNSKGGLFGRQVKIIIHDVGTAALASNPDQQASIVCTDFVQDHRVMAVYNLATTLDTGNFRSCLAKAHIPIISASSAITDTAATKGLESYFYQTAMVPWDKLAPVLVSRLKAQGYFGGWNPLTGSARSAAPRVGILSSTTPAGTRVAAAIKKALADQGYPGALVYQWTDASQGQNSSVNYFNGNGVDHVIVTDLELTAFQNSANNQSYKPRYGISSYNDPYTNLETLSPAGANVGAVGVGWAPGYDVSDANDPGSTGPGQKTCLALMAKGGQSFSGHRTARALALDTCDGILLIAQGAQAGGGLTASAIYAGALRISPTFSSAVSFGNSALSATHLYIPSAVRDLAWVVACKCFRYKGTATTAHL